MQNRENKDFWFNIFWSFIIVTIIICVLKTSVFAEEKEYPKMMENGNVEMDAKSFNKFMNDLQAYDQLRKVDAEKNIYIDNLKGQANKLHKMNQNNEEIIRNNEKIVKRQEKFIELQHKDINRLIEEKEKVGEGGIVDDVKKQAAIPMFIWILLSLI
tara:strand:+ start:66 stop:536 length:471 start_codon:yes stop_codon:yes gene_type:complete